METDLIIDVHRQMIDLIRVEARFLSDEEKRHILGLNAQNLLARWQKRALLKDQSDLRFVKCLTNQTIGVIIN